VPSRYVKEESRIDGARPIALRYRAAEAARRKCRILEESALRIRGDTHQTQSVGGVHVSTRGHRSGCPPHRSCIHQPVCARWAPTCVFEVVHVRRRLRLRAHDDVLVHVVVVCAVRGATQLRNPDVCQPRNDEAPCSEVVVPASPLPRCCFSQVERAQRWLRGRE
jgi:hypothetical protein